MGPDDQTEESGGWNDRLDFQTQELSDIAKDRVYQGVPPDSTMPL